MTKVSYVQQDGSRTTVEVDEGTSVMQGAIGAGVPGIVAECGGNAMCATCHVYVETAEPEGAEAASRLPPVSEDEDAMLEVAAASRLPTSRLSCQLRAGVEINGLVVRIPETQL